MVSNRHPVTKALVYIFVIVALTTSSGLLMGKAPRRAPVENGLMQFGWGSEEPDTCAIEIMEKYNCTEEACTDMANYINYLYLQNCSSPTAQKWFSLLWVFILILLLVLLASTADSYFCVVMDSIVEKLNIPPSIAGVTFLAFGNGAPDVFSLIMSVLGGMTEIGVGANMGAGMFITSVIAGCVAVFSNCEINKSSFLRDIIFYLVAVIYLILVFFDKHIKMWEAIGFLLLYAVYITIVLSRRKKPQDPEAPTMSLLDEVATDPQALLLSPGGPSADGKQGTGMQISLMVESRLHHETANQVLPELILKQSPSQSLEKAVEQVVEAQKPAETVDRRSVKQLVVHAWGNFLELSPVKKVLYVMEFPFTILRDVSCPIVEEDRWNKYWLLLSSVGAPFLIAFFAGADLGGTVMKVVPVWVLLLLVALVLLLCNALCTSFQQPPEKGFYLVVLVLVGFVSSVMWISAIAQELVSLLNALGLMLNISPVILGLTILAWGNSLGDFVSDVSLARQGYPQMAIGGVYASPMFNMLIGMGTSLLISCIKTGTTNLGDDTATINLTFIFLLLTLVSTIIMVPVKKFKFTKGFGFYLFSVYVVYLVLTILMTLGVIRIPFITPK
ncbi:hypothetical protein WA588_003835 [Blastocystis sp. NMH]